MVSRRAALSAAAAASTLVLVETEAARAAAGLVGSGMEAYADPDYVTPPTAFEVAAIRMIREGFDGSTPEGGLLAWMEAHSSDDFTATYGAVVLARAEYASATGELLSSFPDLRYSCPTGDFVANDGFVAKFVEWTGVVEGTLSGRPYAPMRATPPVAASEPPVAVRTEPATFRVYLAPDDKIKSLVVLPSSETDVLLEGLEGPGLGLWLQAGGDVGKLPKQRKPPRAKRGARN